VLQTTNGTCVRVMRMRVMYVRDCNALN